MAGVAFYGPWSAPARFRRKRMPFRAQRSWLVRGAVSFAFRHRYVESVQGRRDQGVEADQIDQLIGSVLAEGLEREAIKRLG
jgi:hypothetical protein